MSNKQTTVIKILSVISLMLLVVSISTGYRYFRWKLAHQKLASQYRYIGHEVHPKTTQEIIDITFTDDDTIQKLYQMLKDTSELLEKAQIRYAAYGGAAIGILRHGGLIPWDDDVDLAILHEDEWKLIALIPEFEKLGYKIVRDDLCYRIFNPKNTNAYPDIDYTYPVVELFVVFENKEKNTIEHISWKARKFFPKQWLPADKFFPLSSNGFFGKAGLKNTSGTGLGTVITFECLVLQCTGYIFISFNTLSP